MTCCEPIVQPFANVSSVSIPYGAIQKAEYGETPNVQVYIFDGDDYVLSDDGNQIVIGDSSIEVDVGGVNTGFVKVF